MGLETAKNAGHADTGAGTVADDASTAKSRKPELLDGMPRRTDRRRPSRSLRVSFLLCVVLPSLLAAWYWLNLASDRYVTSAGFVVRSVSQSSGGDMLGSLTGLVGATSTTSDTGIVLRYLRSRDLVEGLERKLNLRHIFADPAIDWPHRLGSETAPIEDLVEHWNARLTTTHDTVTGLVTFDVEAFTPDDSLAIANIVIDRASHLVNEISQKTRDDILATSRNEVRLAEERLRAASDAERAFRSDSAVIDPIGDAASQTQLIAGIEAKRADIRQRITLLRSRKVVENSPQLVSLLHEEQSLLAEIGNVKTRSAERASRIKDFESLELEKRIAQEAYSSALASLEASRIRADSDQRYLAIYSQPQLAQSSVVPRRFLMSVLTAAGLLLLWSIGTLATSHIRDRMH